MQGISDEESQSGKSDLPEVDDLWTPRRFTTSPDIEGFFQGIAGLHFAPGKRYLSDVIVFKAGESDRLRSALISAGETYTGSLFFFVFESDHVHVVHDCPYSNCSCRCKWRKHPLIVRNVRPRLRRQRGAANTLLNLFTIDDWKAIFFYFIVRKWECFKALWTAGRRQAIPDFLKDLRLAQSDSGTRMVYGEAERDALLCGPELHVPEIVSQDHRQRDPNSRKKRSNFERICETTKILLSKYYPIPPDRIADIIPPTSPDFDMILHDPKNEKSLKAACNLFKLELKDLNFSDFCNLFYENENAVFYSHDLNPFLFYHDLETSTKFLIKLLMFQFDGDEDEIRYFLTNLRRWFNREGWEEKDGSVNIKLNCIICWGPPNCGKNYFWDTITSIACNVGHIARVNNKTNNFCLQDTYNRRILVGNEISMEEGAKEDFKKLCEGSALNVRVKHSSDKIVIKTPVLFISNHKIVIVDDPAFKDIRTKSFYWQKFEELKESHLKPYPPAIFSVFKHFNVSVD